jgi:hypothetical protein
MRFSIAPDGNLPQPKSGEGVVIDGGVYKPINVEVIESARVQVSSSEFKIQVAVQTPNKEIRTVLVTGDLTATRGDFLLLSGEGYRAGTKITAWIFSTPINLGEIEVKADGKYTGALAIPSSVDLRSHTLQINGFRIDTNVTSVSLRLNVVQPESAPPINEKASAGNDSSKSDGNNSSGSGNTNSTTPKPLTKVLFFKTGSSVVDSINKSRIKDFRSNRTSGSTLTCVGYTPTKTSNLKKAITLARAQATAACKNFISTYKKNSLRTYKVSVKKITSAPKSSYKRAGKSQRVDLIILPEGR